MIAAASIPRPDPGPVDFLGLPPELRGYARFLHWRHELRDNDWAKVPFDPRTGRPIDPTSAAHCLPYLLAAELYTTYAGACAGIGFSFDVEEGICGIDLDDCVDEQGNISPEAQRLVRLFDTYAEFSPSGTGIKLFVRGRKPDWAKCTSTALDGIGKIEIYDRKRYFTLTGKVVPGCGQLISERQDQLEALCARLWPQREERADVVGRIGGGGFEGDDEALLRKARSATNGQKFSALFDRGDTSDYGGDESAADAALACHLTFWCGPDRDRIERLFSASSLGQREKWQREDYRRMTIAFGIENTKVYYQCGAQMPRREPRRAASMSTVRLDTDEHRVIGEAVAALGRDESLYARGGSIVELFEVGEQGISIQPLCTPRLREVITQNVELTKINSQGQVVPAHPTSWLVRGVEGRRRWSAIRRLRMVSRTPVLRPDGSVFQTPGYDEATQVVYAPSGVFPTIPTALSHDHACTACDRLLDVVRDFPFTSHAHTAAYLAALLSPVARHAFRGPCPLFLFDANVRGVGKTKLAQIIGLITQGSEIPTSSYCHDSNEFRKQVTTVAIAGYPVVLLDNLAGVLGNDALDRVLTSEWWQDRVLGTSTSFSGPMLTVWYATGNNVQLAADTDRRVVYIRLDSPCEHPEDRATFKYPDVVRHVAGQREQLYVDAVTILAAYLQAGGQDMGLRPFGSFVGWSDLVRSAVVWLGLPDPCSTRDEMEVAADSGRDALAGLMDAWEVYDRQAEGLIAAELVRRLYTAQGQRPDDDASNAMRDALELFVPTAGGKPPTARQVGNRLRLVRRRVIGGRMLDTAGDKGAKGHVWHLRRVEGSP